MTSSATAHPNPRPALAWLGLALLTALPVWWWHALPVLTFAKAARHSGHFATVFAHMIGGTAMLFAGAAALYIGITRRHFHWHRRVGLTYLTIGSVGAATGLALSLLNAHGASGIAIATGTLALFWLAVAALAYRAARNHRYDVHREMMIRSYVLTWTFVGCRLAGRVPPLNDLGDAGGAAIVWLSWVGPFVICELLLQWQRTTRTAAR